MRREACSSKASNRSPSLAHSHTVRIRNCSLDVKKVFTFSENGHNCLVISFIKQIFSFHKPFPVLSEIFQGPVAILTPL